MPDSVGESEARSAAVQEETAVPVVVLALGPVAQRQPVGGEGLVQVVGGVVGAEHMVL